MTADAQSSVTAKCQVAIVVRTVAWLFAHSHGLQFCCSSLPGGFLGIYLGKLNPHRNFAVPPHPLLSPPNLPGDTTPKRGFPLNPLSASVVSATRWSLRSRTTPKS